MRDEATHNVEGDDLSVGLLDLLQLSEVVPESRLGDNVVGSENSHSVELGGLLRLGGELSPDNGVLGESAHSALSADIQNTPSKEQHDAAGVPLRFL